MKTPAKFAAYGLGALGVILAIGIGALLVFDWNRLAVVIADRASEATGRRVAINGGLSLDIWSWTPQAVARDIVLGNASWGSRPEMVRIEQLHVRIRLKPLLAGRLEIERLRLVAPDILLEASDEKANWRFGAPNEKDRPPDEDDLVEEREDFPVVHRLVVERGRIGYRSPHLAEPIDAEIERLEMRTASYEQPVELAAKGRYKGKAVELQGQLAPFRQLRDDSAPYRVDLSGRVDDTSFAFDGGIRDPAGSADISSQLEVEGKTLAELHEWLGLPLPETEPYALAGTLERQGGVWSLHDLHARLGDSEANGDIRFHADETPPRIEGDLQSDNIVLDDLTPFVGGGGTTQDSESSTGPEAPQKRDASGRLFPDEPFALPKLRRMNADIRFAGKAVSGGPLDVRNIEANLKIDGGKLTLDPLTFGLAEGKIRLNVRFHANAKVPALAAGIDVAGVDLNALLALIGVENEAAGLVRGKVSIETRGDSMHTLAAGAAGGGILLMEGGQIGNLLLEAIALDLQEALAQWASDDQSRASINCLAMPLKIRDGKLFADPWFFDTSDALVEIRGTVDLGRETIDLTLKPYPKDFSLFNSLTTISIKGDLAQRTASVNALEAAGKLVLKTLAAPLMTVLSDEIEKEAQRRTPCGRLLVEFGDVPTEGPNPPTAGDNQSPKP